MPDIAFVGLGRMGTPMCASLVRAGYAVAATDTRAEREPAAVWPIREQALKQGVEVLEAPAGGGIAAARGGTLQLFVGGEERVLDRHRALLEVLGDPTRIVHVGGYGTGYTAKLLVNLLWFGQAVATTEALLLGQRAGIDPAMLRHVLADSPAASNFIRSDIGLVFRGGRRE